ncbi:MAG: hypothetical protein ACXAEX_08590 [Promethearchaeota archaeon]|jgi:hypothetical protein
MTHDRDSWNEEYARMSEEYKQEQLKKIEDNRRMEEETKAIIRKKEREKLRLQKETTQERDRLYKEEELKVDRQLRFKRMSDSPEGRVVMAHEINRLKRERDIASGMTEAEIRERDELRLQLQRHDKRDIHDPHYSADPKKHAIYLRLVLQCLRGFYQKY